MEFPQGQTAPCSGILWGVEESRDALICKTVELPHIEKLLQYTRKKGEAREDALIGRAISAESALAAVPEPTKTSTIVLGAVAVFTVGVLGGLALGILQ